MHEVRLEDFVEWLCQREHEHVGLVGRYFATPLERWLSERAGCVYGVDGVWFGRAAWDFAQWRMLPGWARRFSSYVETVRGRSLTGGEAFLLLARIEWCEQGGAS